MRVPSAVARSCPNGTRASRDRARGRDHHLLRRPRRRRAATPPAATRPLLPSASAAASRPSPWPCLPRAEAAAGPRPARGSARRADAERPSSRNGHPAADHFRRRRQGQRRAGARRAFPSAPPASPPGATRTAATAPTGACCCRARAWRGCVSSCRPRAAATPASRRTRRSADINAAADTPTRGLTAPRGRRSPVAMPAPGGGLCRAPAARPRRRRGGEQAGMGEHRRDRLGRAQGHQRRAGAGRRPAQSARPRRLGSGAAPPPHDAVGRGQRRRRRAHAHRAPSRTRWRWPSACASPTSSISAAAAASPSRA